MIFGAVDLMVIILWLEQWLPTIIPTIAATLPSIAALVGIACSCLKLIKDNRQQITPILQQFEELRAEVRDKTDLREARKEMQELIKENKALRKRLDKQTTYITHIKNYGVEENEDK